MGEIIVPGQEWRERVVVELTEVTEKIVRLRRFMVTEKYFQLSEDHCDLMRMQSFYMSEYADILAKRLGSSDT